MMAHESEEWTFALDDSNPNVAFVQWSMGYAEVHGSRSMRESRARLIAAAPKLLAFAKWFVENRDGPGVAMAQAAIAEAEVATITKAT